MHKMPQARRSGLIVKESEGEVLIYDLETNKAHCLNSTAARIWEYCDGRTPVTEASKALSQSLGMTVDENVIRYAVSQFSKDNLVEDTGVIPAFIAGINRRQMVRTLGLAAAIAVPLVTTMVAPLPAHAASQTAPGTPCCSSATCTSQICNPPAATPLSCSPVNGTCA